MCHHAHASILLFIIFLNTSSLVFLVYHIFITLIAVILKSLIDSMFGFLESLLLLSIFLCFSLLVCTQRRFFFLSDSSSRLSSSNKPVLLLASSSYLPKVMNPVSELL